MGVTQELSKYCSNLTFGQLPQEVVDRVKYFFLDFIGVACRGFMENSSKSMLRFIMETQTGNQAGVIIGTNKNAPFSYAALANGTSGHAIEMDDVHNESSLHPGVAIFPAALAASEMKCASGKNFIEAVVLGYEVMIRLGMSLNPENTYRRGFHPTGVCGPFGAGIAVSKIFMLNENEMTNAMGIAGSQAAGSMEYLAQGAWTKRFHAGWSAHSGMVAAQMAQKGFKGPTSIIEGRDGFLHSYSNGANKEKVLEMIGCGYEILRTSVKPHACCRYMQPPIDAILKIVKDNNIKPHEIERVRLGLLRAGFPLIAEPMEKKYRPESIVDAQFSMPFGAAVAIIYRKAGMREFQIPKIQSDAVMEIMKKVEYFVEPDFDATFPKKWCASAEIITREGKKYFEKIEYPKGDPENPLSWDELIDKFNALTNDFFTKGQRLKIIEQVRKLENIQNLKKWSSILSGKNH